MNLDKKQCQVSARSLKRESDSVFLSIKSLLGILLVVGGVEKALANPPPEIAEPLRIIRAVGPEGRGNAEASRAWKKLAGSEGSMLLPILEATDGANVYALNWLRAAVDSIASRELEN